MLKVLLKINKDYIVMYRYQVNPAKNEKLY